MSYASIAKGVATYGPIAARAGKMIGKLVPIASNIISAYDVANDLWNWASPAGSPPGTPPAPGGAAQAGNCQFNQHGEVFQAYQLCTRMCLGDTGITFNPDNPQQGETLYNIRTKAYANGTAVSNLHNLFRDWSDYLAYSQNDFPLTAAGLAAFDQAVLDGKIEGDGLIVAYKKDIPLGKRYPVFNPHFLTFYSPSGDEVFSTLDVIADVLNNASTRPGLLVTP